MESRHPTEKFLHGSGGRNITGCLTPFRHGQPVLIQLPDNPHFWVAVFSTKDKMEEACVDHQKNH